MTDPRTLTAEISALSYLQSSPTERCITFLQPDFQECADAYVARHQATNVRMVGNTLFCEAPYDA